MNVDCAYVVQAHTTSPLIKAETIKSFTENLINYKWDSFFTTQRIRSETYYENMPLNFDGKCKTPTQGLNAIEFISWSLTGWKRKSFIEAYSDGPSFCGRTGLFVIDKIEAIDVDMPEDLYMAEACLSHLKRKDSVGRHFLNDKTSRE